MPTFDYKGFDEAGRASRGLVEALDLKEARERLAGQGILAERLWVAGGDPGRVAFRRRNVFATEARAMMYRELGALLRAGLPLAQSLEILIGSPELGENRSVLAGVRDRIREGDSLATALKTVSHRITPFEDAVIEVGERAGNLEVVLDRLASFLEEQKAMHERVTTALLYPAIVFILALMIGMAVLGIMVPRIGSLLAESDIALPVLTVVMMTIADVFTAAFLPLTVVAIIAVYLLRRRHRRDPAFRERMDRRVFRIPVAGRAYTALTNLRFARTLSMLIRGGVPLIEGLILSGRATGSPWIATLVEAQAEEVRQGKSLADALRGIPPLQASLPGWVEAGEASGDVSGLLESAGTRYQQQWDRIVNRFLALLEPVLVLVIGGFVLLVALSILMPVLSMNSKLF